MLYPEKVKILAKKNLPKPEEARYWIDLTADPYGGIWKVWNGLTWIRVFASSGSGGGIEEAPSDGNLYGRKNLVWQEIDIPDVSIYATKTELELKADKDSVPDLSDYLTASDIAKYYLPKGNYLTEVPEGYLTITEADGRYALKGEDGGEIDIDLSDYLTIANAESTYATKSEVQTVREYALTIELNKQDTLLNGVNIKSIDGLSIVGSGAIKVWKEAPTDSKLYGRLSALWVEIQLPTDYVTEEDLNTELDTKLDTLVSGTNIKTINNLSILGQGNIEITTGTGGITDAPADGNTYGRKNNQWALVTIPDTSEFATKEELLQKADAEDVASLISTEASSRAQEDNRLSNLIEDETEAREAAVTTLTSNKLDKSTYNSDKLTFALKSEIPTDYLTAEDLPDTSNFATKQEVQAKLDTLISGTNIKTINGASVLGSGNITIETPEGGISDAPQDGKTYGRKDALWSEITIPDTSALATKAEIADMATQTWVGEQGYLTEHQDISNLATKEELASKANTSDLSNYLTIASATSTYATKTDLDSKLDTSTYTSDKSTFATTTLLAGKQDTLVSGTNIKTVNGLTILGEGNISIETPEGGITDAPSDNNTYARKNGAWTAVNIPDTSSYAELTGALFTGTIGAPIIAVVDNSDGMRAAIQSSKNDILFRTYNAGIDSMTFLVQNSTPLKITEAGIWENNALLENKYAKLTDLDDLALKTELPSNVSDLTNDAGYITSTNLSTYATLEYVNTQISNLVNSAPEALNTLDELAAALNDDSNFATTVTNQIAAKLDITTYTSDKETFALKTELSSKADSSALANYLTTATAESTYAKKSEIPQLSLLPYDFFGEVEYTHASGGTDTITISGDKYSTYCIGSGTANVTFGDLIDGVEYHLLVRANAGTITLGIPDLGAKYEVFVIGDKTLFTVEDNSILEMSFMSYGDLIVCRVSESSSYVVAYNNTSGGEDSFG